jgi:hypothetical protein
VSLGRAFDLLPVWMHDELFDLEDRLLRLVDVEAALTNNDPHIGEIIGAKSQQILSNISS